MTEHTPGPWKVGYQEGPGDGTSQTIDAGWQTLAVLENPHDDPVIEANARLMAAAPKLLEALKRIKGLGSETPAMGRFAKAQEIARAAIKEVEG